MGQTGNTCSSTSFLSITKTKKGKGGRREKNKPRPLQHIREGMHERYIHTKHTYTVSIRELIHSPGGMDPEQEKSAGGEGEADIAMNQCEQAAKQALGR
jgi:hypothetical protein